MLSSSGLVKGPVLAVAMIDLGLDGREDVINHGVDLILPKVMGMEGAIHLASILGCCELLHMLPHAGGREQRVEDRPNLFRVSEKGWDKGSLNFNFIPLEVPVDIVSHDRAAGDGLVVDRGVLGQAVIGVVFSKSGVFILVFFELKCVE